MLCKAAFQSRKIFSRVACVPSRFWNLQGKAKGRDEFLLEVECPAGQEGWPENLSGTTEANFL